MSTPTPPLFACDAMLGSLARWLRAAGYDASWQAHIADWDLIRWAGAEGRILLSCDTGIFRIGIIRDGDVPSMQLPAGLTTQEQLHRVLQHFQLPLREPLCMLCGGVLREVPREQMADKVPPRSLAWAERFWECQKCGQPFWQGTHWEHIRQVLEQVGQGLPPPQQ